MRSVFLPKLNRNIVFGRKRPHPGAQCLHLRNYLRSSLPTPPPSADYTSKASQELSNIDENDSLGDCVIAGGYHIVGVETGNAGNQFIATNAQITKDYTAIGGYIPGNPNTDNGCDIPTALGYWATHGFANGTKLLGFLAVDPTNVTEVQQALYLFENLMLGLELPDAWISPFPSGNGFTWDIAGNPDPENGHCIIGAGYAATGTKILGYNAAGLIISTWGMLGILTWAALAKYCSAKNYGELYVLLTPDQVTKGQTIAPNGVSWSELISDFDALGGNVPVPTPTPVPVNPPTPTPPNPTPPTPTPPTPSTGVTLAQATQWATEGLKKSPFVITRPQAESIVKKSLTTNWPK